jgi:DNA-binding transcriptional regulator YiaG
MGPTAEERVARASGTANALRVAFDRDGDGWHASLPDVPGCRTWGSSLDVARRHLREALATCVDAFPDAAAVAANARFFEEVQVPTRPTRVLERCALCGYAGAFELVATTEEAVIGERAFRADVAAERCPSCREVFTPAEEPMAFGEAVARRLIVDGDVSGASFRYLRHTLGVTGQALAEMLGVEPELVSRWEQGDRDVDRLAWAVLAMLVLEASAPRAGVAAEPIRVTSVLAACRR